jgi:GT2 family glycosyltransferase
MTVLASIVTPVHNNWTFTRGFVDSIYASLASDSRPDGDLEVIIVDNGSTDETAVELAKIQKPGFRPVRAVRNLGFAGGTNLGAKEAQGKYLVFLNNDMLVLPGALRALVDSVRASDAIGIVSGRLLFADCTIQHAGVVFDTALHPNHVFRGFPAEHPFVLVRRELQAVTGACMILERGLFESVGRLDEGFRNGFEDLDLCMKVRDAGKQVIYDPNVLLFHFESMSDSRFDRETENRRRFLERWRSRVTSDERERTLLFAYRLRDGLRTEIRQTLETISPYRSVPYPRWSSDPRARELSEKMAKLIACEETLRRAAGSVDVLKTSWSQGLVEDELLKTKRSLSYRVGRLITWLPRKIVGPYY